MIGHIPELTEAGINSFKIEGRVKSAYYTAVTANAYKTELLKYLADKEHYTFDGKSLYELESVSHREYATGFFFDDCSQNAQITQNGGYLRDKAFLATVSEIDEKTGRALLLQRNQSLRGRRMRVGLTRQRLGEVYFNRFKKPRKRKNRLRAARENALFR